MERRPIHTGCTPVSASVLGGAGTGFLALTISGRGLTPVGLLWLLGGYVIGAMAGHLLIVLLGRAYGEWWHD